MRTRRTNYLRKLVQVEQELHGNGTSDVRRSGRCGMVVLSWRHHQRIISS